MVVSDDWNEVNDKYDFEIKNGCYEAIFFIDKNTDEYVIVITNIEDLSVLAHEVVHIVNAIFTSCGIELDKRNDEPQAYLTGWVFKEIQTFIKELNTIS